MNRMQLTARERNQLETQLKQTQDAKLYRRLLAVLRVDRGWPVPEVAGFLDVDRTSVYRWVNRYGSECRASNLADRPGRGRPRLWEPDHLAFLASLMEDSPQDWGYAATCWTVPLLREHLERCGLPPCSKTTLRRRVHELDRVWKRPRYELEPDPQAEKKTSHPGPAHASAGPQCRAVRGRD